jgi:hypothetical protein
VTDVAPKQAVQVNHRQRRVALLPLVLKWTVLIAACAAPMFVPLSRGLPQVEAAAAITGIAFWALVMTAVDLVLRKHARLGLSRMLVVGVVLLTAIEAAGWLVSRSVGAIVVYMPVLLALDTEPPENTGGFSFTLLLILACGLQALAMALLLGALFKAASFTVSPRRCVVRTRVAADEIRGGRSA